ncbi:MAG: prepilin-type N-terminal cleavage/methylation domain-containing protein [Pseudomonadota bacterium]
MRHASGFTLIELAIVLVIMTILIGGLAVPLSTQLKARQFAQTKAEIEAAREAIIGYTRLNRTAANRPYLPCPDITGDGREDRTGTACTSATGNGLLPWVDLGLTGQDAWNNRLRYATHPDSANSNVGFTDSPPPILSANLIHICVSRLCGDATPDVSSNVIFILYSNGPNGRGALNVNRSWGQFNAAPTSSDEQENLDEDLKFVSRPPNRTEFDDGGAFDDVAGWMSLPELLPRACPTGCP